MSKTTITITIDGGNVTVNTSGGGGGKSRKPSGEFIPPGGSGQPMPGKKGQAGLTIGQAEMADLVWWRDALPGNIDDPDKARFRDRNREDLDALRAEIARREGGSQDDYGGSGGAGGDDEIPFSPHTLP